MTTAGVILAAGRSSRLGQPKQMARVGGEMLLERAVRIASAAGLHPVLVVLGADAGCVESQVPMPGAVVLRNVDWEEGMAASVRVGIAAVPDRVDGAILMTCDQPAVTAEHLRVLQQSAGGRMLASSYAGRLGVPAYFPRSAFAGLLCLKGDAGARDLLREARSVPLPDGEVDIDTPEALALAQRRFGGGMPGSV